MIASPNPKTQVLVEPNVSAKLEDIRVCVEWLLSGGTVEVPQNPGRDIQILPLRQLPPKPGLGSREGQGRLVHDLASIELQAMELGVRTLAEFPEAPRKFREELGQITIEEGQHLLLCLNALQSLAMKWGDFPTHLGLWQAVDRENSLLDRILIVHRYLEGAGLDASETILRRLSGAQAPPDVQKAVEIIRRDEMAHVQFGSHWYHIVAKGEGLNPEVDFASRMERLSKRLPRRREPVSAELRRAAGFTPIEIAVVRKMRERFVAK